MMFEEKYNNSINLLCSLNEKFKRDFEKALKIMPQSMIKKCKSSKAFTEGNGEMLGVLSKIGKKIDFSVNDEEDLYIRIEVSPLEEKVVEKMKEYDVVEALCFSLDIGKYSASYGLEIRKVKNDKFVLTCRQNHNYQHFNESYIEISKKELIEKLNRSNKR